MLKKNKKDIKTPKKKTPPKKAIWPAGNLLWPAPAALVSCQYENQTPNFLTVAWCGTVNSEPPMLAVGIRPNRYSYEIIEKSQEFVVNLPSVKIAKATDKAGVISGREGDKFLATNLTPAPGSKVACPIIAECPINLECKVTQKVLLPTHALYIAEIVAVQVTEKLISPQGRLQIEKANLLAYAHGFYFAMGKQLDKFGWSVRKNKKN